MSRVSHSLTAHSLSSSSTAHHLNIQHLNISSSASHRHLSSLITHHIDSDTSSHSCSRDGEDGTAETTNDHSDDDKDGGSVRCCGLSADRRRGCRGRSGSSGNRQGPTTAPRQAAGPSVRVPQNTVSVGASAGIEVASPAGRSGLFITSEKKRPMVTSIVMINGQSLECTTLVCKCRCNGKLE